MKEITEEVIGEAVKQRCLSIGGQAHYAIPAEYWVGVGIQLAMEAMKPDDVFKEGHGEYDK